MTALSSYRALSWLCVLGVIGFLVWITVVPSGFPGTPIVVGLTFCLVVATLKLGVREPVAYWKTVADPDQVLRVTLMIITLVSLELLVGAILQFLDQLNWLSALILSRLFWVAIPMAFLMFEVVRWPKRHSSPRLREFLIVSGLTILVATVMFLLTSTPPEGQQRILPPLGTLATYASVLIVGATMEEVVYRVLLLTALVQATRSPTQALILSSVLFGLTHLPFALAQPIVAMDWDLLSQAATSAFPKLVLQLAVGFWLGAIWLRTGSLPLIAITHAFLNLGDVVVGGLQR